MTVVDQSEVWADIKLRAQAEISGVQLFWPLEPNELPDQPAPFVYFDMVVDPTRAPVAFGGGRQRNLYQYRAELVGYLFLPRNYGLADSTKMAERIAKAFRSYRSDAISCFGATPIPAVDGAAMVPPGLKSAADQYDCTAIAVALTFDQIG